MDNRLALSLLALLLLSAGCQPGSSLPVPVVAPAPTAAPLGGTVVIADWEAPSNFAVLSARTQADLRAGAMVFSPLWDIGPDHRPSAQLTETVPTPENGGVRQEAGRTVVRVALRRGLRWSDGFPLTALDAAFTWASIRDAGGGAGFGLDQVFDVQALSDRNLKITFKAINSAYLLIGPALRPVPQHRLGTESPAGWASSPFFALPDAVSGPFKPLSIKPGQEAHLIRNPLFGGPGGPATLDAIVYRAYSGHDAELAALAAGEADLGLHLAPGDLAELASQRAARPVVVPGLRQEFLSPNHAAPLWAGPDSRLLLGALSASIDRRRLVAMLSPRGLPQSDLFGQQRAPAGDLEGAGAALDAGGWTRGSDGIRARAGTRLSFELVAPCGSPEQADELEFLKQTWLQLGVEARTGCRDRTQLLAGFAEGGLIATGHFEMALYSYSPAPDPSGWAPLGVSDQIPTSQSNAGENWNRCSDPSLDRAFRDGQASFDPGRRRAAYRRAEDAWLAYHCTIPLFTAAVVVQVARRLHEVEVNPALQLETWRPERWWIRA